MRNFIIAVVLTGVAFGVGYFLAKENPETVDKSMEMVIDYAKEAVR